MFVALREIRTARGRFALMVTVVALITLLLAVLTALTQGLGRQSTSALDTLDGRVDRIVLTPTSGTTATYGDSVVTAAQARTWSAAAGVEGVEPLAIGHARVARPGTGSAASVALWGAPPTGVAARTLTDQAPATPPLDERAIVLPQDTADALGVRVGDPVDVEGHGLRVAAVRPTRWYSHSPVALVTSSTFAQVGHLARGQVGSALLVRTTGSDEALAALDARAGTVALSPGDSLGALPGYRSERSSLLLVQGFLYAISALVVLAFVSVWTIQRTRDLAVLRALGASRRYVLGDALGQAASLLVVGTLLGGALGASTVLALRDTAPVLAGPTTFAVPVLGIAVLGLLGSAAATRRVSRVDPLLALGGS
ncbi:ABC transporter permease [Arsenicicoccus dermatophilus]|uniref:ABC transporter permease n=1 Tax=Arsenicicoccus dermatophilus TaxID=1076331 RepID=UPI001F4C6084|nr:ABC transporter permease [Arsenicicoccus dermatophilus]MCH8613922.1 ABC transporter permease [Arsenicicoccus dermatophilus]